MSASLDAIIDKVRQHPKLIIAEDFEIAAQHISSTSTKFHNGEPVRRGQEDRVWISLRILHRRQPGRAVIGQATREAINGLVESAFESSRRSSPDPWFRFPLWKRPRVPGNGEGAPTDREHAVLDYTPLFVEVATPPEIFEENYEVSHVSTQLLRKTERFQLTSSHQIHAMQLSLLRHSSDKFFWLREDRAHSRPLAERREWVDSLLHHASELRKGHPMAVQGEISCLMSPAVIAALLRRMAAWFYADLVQGGRSPLAQFRAEMKGGALLSPQVTLIDDGALPGGVNAAPFDMEGSLTQETCLVDRGRVSELLYDTYSATRENRISTGNFIRTAQAFAPRISASNFYLKPSSATLGDLLGSFRSGLYLQSVDSLELVPGSETEFFLRGTGWRMQGEECVHPILDLALRFDIFDLFRRVAQVGNDLTFYGAFGSPSVLFDKVPVSQ